MSRSVLLSTIFAVLFIVIVTSVIIFFARGYTFNPRSGQIQKTGIMVITSEPSNAAVYLDNELKDTTNTTINFLAPGNYTVKVTKEGFTPWVKTVTVKPELVSRIDVVLFPEVPDLRRLTYVGVNAVAMAPDGSKAVYYVTDPTKKGLWVMNLSTSLPFVNSDPIQIYKDTGQIDFAKASYVIAPDGKSMLITDNSKPTPTYYMLNDLGSLNDTATPMDADTLMPILTNWHDFYYSKVVNLRDKLSNSVHDIPSYDNPHPDISPILDSLNLMLQQTALVMPSSSPAVSASVPAQPSASVLPAQTPDTVASIITKITQLAAPNRWSPKQDRILYQEKGSMKVYDLTTGQAYPLPKADSISWLPTDTNLVLVNPNGKKGEIAVADYDGQNQVVIFSGQFVDNIAIPWADGTKIVILTNLNQAAGSDPNLYTINLR